MRCAIPAARPLGGLLFSAAVVLLTACNKDLPADPADTGGDVTGAWTAVAFGGNPLPIADFVQDSTGVTCRRELRGVDLTFSGSGGYTWVEEVYLDCNSGIPRTVTNTFTGTWHVDGIHLYMLDSAAEQAAEQSYTFTVQNAQLSMRVKVGGISLTSVFQRST